MPQQSKVKEGAVFDFITVLTVSSTDLRGRKSWNCACKCGKKLVIPASNLSRKNRNTRSCGCRRKDPDFASQKASLKSLYAMYKYDAGRRNRTFSLSLTDFSELTSGNCVYCGVEPKQKCHPKEVVIPYFYNGIDRTDNTVGYELGNVVSCCRVCNKAKSSLTLEEWKTWLQRVSFHQRNCVHANDLVTEAA